MKNVNCIGLLNAFKSIEIHLKFGKWVTNIVIL